MSVFELSWKQCHLKRFPLIGSSELGVPTRQSESLRRLGASPLKSEMFTCLQIRSKVPQGSGSIAAFTSVARWLDHLCNGPRGVTKLNKRCCAFKVAFNDAGNKYQKEGSACCHSHTASPMETNVFSQVSVSAQRVADGLCPEPIRRRVGTIRPPPCVRTCFTRVNWNANYEWVVYFPWASSKVKTCMCNFYSISCQSLLVTGPHTGPWNIWKVPHWQSKRVWLWNIPTYTSFTFIVAYVLGINFKRKYSAEGGGWWSEQMQQHIFQLMHLQNVNSFCWLMQFSCRIMPLFGVFIYFLIVNEIFFFVRSHGFYGSFFFFVAVLHLHFLLVCIMRNKRFSLSSGGWGQCLWRGW